MKNLKVCIVDDNAHFVKAFRFMLEDTQSEKIDKIYEAKNGQECLDLLKEKPIDVVFMDIDMPVMSGIEATKKIVDAFWGVKVVAISFHSEMSHIKEMLEAGARNYIIKEDINKEILEFCLA